MRLTAWRRTVGGDLQEDAMRPKDAGPVYQITGVRRGLREDIRYRQQRYVISMSIRTGCFVLAILTTGVLRWTFFVLALVLPYLSVVFANGGREPAPPPPDTLLKESLPEIDPSPERHGRQ
jgi:hypothetical protein